MKTYVHSIKSHDPLLHVETEGAIINIRVGLTSAEGQSVTSVEILPDPEWTLDGHINSRLIHKEEVKQ